MQVFFTAANAKLEFFLTRRTQGFLFLELIINEEIAKLGVFFIVANAKLDVFFNTEDARFFNF